MYMGLLRRNAPQPTPQLARNVMQPNGGMMQNRMNAAHGGHATGNHMEEAHFNKDELMAMDLVQGGRIRDPHTGLPVYTKLAHELLNHPDQKEHLEHLMELGHMHHAGHETHLSHALREAAEHGRFGDTEIAKIPHSLSTVLDHIVGGPSYNEDGRKEYFLGALLSLVTRAIPAIVGAVGRAAPVVARVAPRIASAAARVGSKVASKVAPMARNAMNVVRTAARSPIGKQVMGVAKNVGNQVAQNAVSNILQPQPQAVPAQEMPPAPNYGGDSNYYQSPGSYDDNEMY